MSAGVQLEGTHYISRRLGNNKLLLHWKRNQHSKRFACQVCHSYILAVKWMEEMDVFRDEYRCQRSVLDDCSLCIQKTVTNMAMLWTPYVEVGLEAVISVYVAVMNELSIGRGGYFVTGIDEASDHMRALHMRLKAKKLTCRSVKLVGLDDILDA